jgi:lipoate-protein ligase A
VLGCRESATQALDLEECRARQVAVQRRLSGGATWLLDEHQIGWALYLHRREVGGAEMRAISRRVIHAAATAISALGVDARYRSPDEIEVDGRTLSWTAHAAEGAAVMVHGIVLVDVDYERAAHVLRLPLPAAYDGAAAALRTRLVGLKELLGRPPDLHAFRRNLAEAFESEFDIELRESDLSMSEGSRYARALLEVDTAGWVDLVATPASDVCLVEASRVARGRVLSACVRYERGARTIRQVWFSGDAALQPLRALCALESRLKDVHVERLAREIESFFTTHGALHPAHAQPRDYVAVVELATGQPLVA